MNDKRKGEADRKMNKKDAESQRTSEMDAVVGSAIGQKLRKLYSEIASEPVPDRFADLLRQLEKDESEGNDK